MGDSWDDEDLDLDERLAPAVSSVFTAPVAAANNWEDEEDLVEVDAKFQAAKLTPDQIAANEKKQRQAEIAQENKLKAEMLKKETPEERKARERRAAEEADNELTGELFGSGGGKSAAGSASSRSGVVVLKTKQDHTNYGNTCATKLAASSAFNLAAFYKALSKTCDSSGVTSEVLNEIIADLTKIRDVKLEKEKPQAKNAVAKKSKKQMKQEAQKHSDVFGGGDYGDDMYADIEDSFM